MKITSDKTRLTVVDGIKKENDSLKEDSRPSFKQSFPQTNYSNNSINEMRIQNQDANNDYLTKHVSIHGKITYQVDVPKLGKNIMSEETIITYNGIPSMYNKNEGYWIRNAESYLNHIITEKIDIAYKNDIRNNTYQYIIGKTYSNENIKFDSVANAVTFKNGTFYYPEQKKDRGYFIEKHDINNFSTTKIPHNFNQEDWETVKVPTKTFNALKKFMNEEEAYLIFEFIGSLFYKKPAKPRGVFILTGGGENGKSRLIECIQRVIGDGNYNNISLDLLINNDFAPILLLGKHLNACGDIDADFFSKSASFKELTGGDSMLGQYKGKDGIKINPFCRMLFSANKLPKFKDDTNAITSRMVFVEMPFKPTSEDVDVLYSAFDNEIETIITFSINLFTNVLEKEGWTLPLRSIEIKEEWTKDSNNVHQFYDDCCLLGNTMGQTKKKVYEAYKEYCLINGLESCKAKTFHERLSKLLGFEAIKKEPGMVYSGLEVFDPKG